MLGAAHALANPLTANCGIAHGQAIAVMLPHVIRRNGRQVETLYQELLQCGGEGELKQGETATETFALYIVWISLQAGLAATLKEHGISRGDLPELAVAASKQWTGQFNPVELTNDDYLKLYEAAY